MATIDEYAFGRIVIDGQEQHADVILLPSRTVTRWWRRRGHQLVIEDLAGVLDELPEQLLIGTGAQGRMRPDPDAIHQLEARGVMVEVLPTAEAVRRYRELDAKHTAAALHLTC